MKSGPVCVAIVLIFGCYVVYHETSAAARWTAEKKRLIEKEEIQAEAGLQAERKLINVYLTVLRGRSLAIAVRDRSLVVVFDKQEITGPTLLPRYTPGKFVFGISPNQYGPKQISISGIVTLKE